MPHTSSSSASILAQISYYAREGNEKSNTPCNSMNEWIFGAPAWSTVTQFPYLGLMYFDFSHTNREINKAPAQKKSILFSPIHPLIVQWICGHSGTIDTFMEAFFFFWELLSVNEYPYYLLFDGKFRRRKKKSCIRCWLAPFIRPRPAYFIPFTLHT